MALIDTVIVFLVGLLIGALGIYVGARVLTDADDYTYAIVTALIGSVVWAVIAFFVGGIPFLGPLLALIAYLGVINWRYPGGWTTSAGIALIAWVSVLVILYVLAFLELATFEAVGVPGL
ncbi:hypothetical protein [Halorarum halobium]|uniref:hypothetical protein n=1 Tax=Halorarum halobium TaxID=3075121 RepID=UPI0028A94DC8|nr:hypothetical protein [Halobaculum sp. XH14]